MHIRTEREEDYSQIYEVVKKAFEKAEHSDGNEQDLVEKLRKNKAYINSLSLVCEDNDKIVGYVMFTKNKIGKVTGLTLAPLAILPKYQHRRLGTLLVKSGLKIAKELGYEYVVVLGNPKYYNRFGFVTSKEFGIKSPFDVPSKNFMALNLIDNDDREDLNSVLEFRVLYKSIQIFSIMM